MVRWAVGRGVVAGRSSGGRRAGRASAAGFGVRRAAAVADRRVGVGSVHSAGRGRPSSALGRGWCRRSTATSWGSTRISASFAASERASSASQLNTRASSRYASRKATTGDHAARAVGGCRRGRSAEPGRPGQTPCHGSRHPQASTTGAAPPPRTLRPCSPNDPPKAPKLNRPLPEEWLAAHRAGVADKDPHWSVG
jgi:hypothetical protein